MQFKRPYRFAVRALSFLGILFICIPVASFAGLIYFSYSFLGNLALDKKQIIIQTQQNKKQNASSTTSHQLPQAKDSSKADFTGFAKVMKQLHQVQSIKRLRDMISKEEAPQLCEIICKPGRFFIHQITDAPVDKLYDYYNHEGKESLNDPNFRFAVDEVALIAEIFPASLQDLLSEIELFSSKTEPASELDKLSLSARITSSFFRELYMMNQNIDRTKSYSRALAKVTGLRKQCESGNDVQVMTDCQKILKIESN